MDDDPALVEPPKGAPPVLDVPATATPPAPALNEPPAPAPAIVPPVDPAAPPAAGTPPAFEEPPVKFPPRPELPGVSRPALPAFVMPPLAFDRPAEAFPPLAAGAPPLPSGAALSQALPPSAAVTMPRRISGFLERIRVLLHRSEVSAASGFTGESQNPDGSVHVREALNA
jgi:hypothetical protein